MPIRRKGSHLLPYLSIAGEAAGSRMYADIPSYRSPIMREVSEGKEGQIQGTNLLRLRQLTVNARI